jgi:hypothetical protein
MRKPGVVLLCALCSVSGLCGVACDAPVMAKTETVTGQVVDLYCYNVETKANAGMDHTQGRACAYACAKWEGQPVGLVTADGKVYQLAGALVANSNAKIVPHLTHTVTVTGDVSDKNGIMVLSATDVSMVTAPQK